MLCEGYLRWGVTLPKPLQLYYSDFDFTFFHSASTQALAAYSPSKAWMEGDTSKLLLLAEFGCSLVIVWGLFLTSYLKEAFFYSFPCESFIVHFIIQYGCHQSEQAARQVTQCRQGKSQLAKAACLYFCNNSPSRHSPIWGGSTHIARVGTYKDRNIRVDVGIWNSLPSCMFWHSISNLRTQEAEEETAWVRGHPGLHRAFQTILWIYRETLCQKQSKTTTATTISNKQRVPQSDHEGSAYWHSLSCISSEEWLLTTVDNKKLTE